MAVERAAGGRMSEERLRELVDMFGGEEARRERLRLYKESLAHLEAHRDELTAQYPDEWIGIRGQRVEAHGGSAGDVVRTITEAGGSLDGVVLHLMRTDDVLWLL